MATDLPSRPRQRFANGNYKLCRTIRSKGWLLTNHFQDAWCERRVEWLGKMDRQKPSTEVDHERFPDPSELHHTVEFYDFRGMQETLVRLVQRIAERVVEDSPLL